MPSDNDYCHLVALLGVQITYMQPLRVHGVSFIINMSRTTELPICYSIQILQYKNIDL